MDVSPRRGCFIHSVITHHLVKRSIGAGTIYLRLQDSKTIIVIGLGSDMPISQWKINRVADDVYHLPFSDGKMCPTEQKSCLTGSLLFPAEENGYCIPGGKPVITGL